MSVKYSKGDRVSFSWETVHTPSGLPAGVTGVGTVVQDSDDTSALIAVDPIAPETMRKVILCDLSYLSPLP